MKILFVNKFLYPRGGAETYFLKIGEELTRRGHEVEYFGMYDEKNTVGNALHLATTNMDFHNAGPEKLLYPFRILYSFEARRKLKQVIGQFQPDLIHFNNINFQLTPSVICAGAECGVPMVQTVHDVQMLCPNHMMMEFNSKKLCEACMGKKSKWPCVKKRCIHGSLPKSLIGAVEGTLYECNHVYDKIDRFICPSAFLEKKLLTVPRFRGKTVMLHNFLSRVAAAAPIEKGDYVLYFGRLSEEKGIDTMGRKGLYEAFTDLYSFSPTFRGYGIGWVTRYISIMNAAGIGVFGTHDFGGMHNDLVTMYIELGFWGFSFWIWLSWQGKVVWCQKQYGTETAFLLLYCTIYAFVTYATDNTAFYCYMNTIFMLLPIGHAMKLLDRNEVIYNHAISQNKPTEPPAKK